MERQTLAARTNDTCLGRKTEPALLVGPCGCAGCTVAWGRGGGAAGTGNQVDELDGRAQRAEGAAAGDDGYAASERGRGGGAPQKRHGHRQASAAATARWKNESRLGRDERFVGNGGGQRQSGTSCGPVNGGGGRCHVGSWEEGGLGRNGELGRDGVSARRDAVRTGAIGIGPLRLSMMQVPRDGHGRAGECEMDLVRRRFVSGRWGRERAVAVMRRLSSVREKEERGRRLGGAKTRGRVEGGSPRGRHEGRPGRTQGGGSGCSPPND